MFSARCLLRFIIFSILDSWTSELILSSWSVCSFAVFVHWVCSSWACSVIGSTGRAAAFASSSHRSCVLNWNRGWKVPRIGVVIRPECFAWLAAVAWPLWPYSAIWYLAPPWCWHCWCYPPSSRPDTTSSCCKSNTKVSGIDHMVRISMLTHTNYL